MDHSKKSIHVIGRSSWRTRFDQWEEWHGPQIYTHICRLHGWDVGDVSTVQAYAVNWVQNGYDCGPISIMVAMHLFQEGLSLEEDGTMQRMAVGCGHMIRLRVHRELGQICRDAYHDFQYFVQQPPEEWATWSQGEDAGTGDYELPPAVVQAITRMRTTSEEPAMQTLVIEMSTCHQCSGIEIVGLSEDRNGGSAGVKMLQGCRGRDVNMPGDLGISDVEPEEAMVESSVPNLKGRSGHLRRKRVDDWKQLDPIQYPRPSPPADVPLRPGALWLRHDRNFDDYEQGPTREDLHAFEDPICNFPLNPFAQMYIKSCWRRFRDYGYRLLTRFAHMFYLGPPTQVSRHLLRDGLPADYRPQDHYHTMLLEPFPLSRSAYPELRMAIHQDVALMGAQEMLEMAGNDFTWMSHDLFIRGKREDGKYVCLDLERDAVPLSSVRMVPSVDLDSLIWVTPLVKTKLKVQLMLTPTIGKTAPIRKNNHVYFELLVPPTDYERDNRGDREWLEKRMPLSACPHTTFAKVAEGLSLYIFFPRMIHRDEYTGHWITLIPLEVQTVFWDKVVLPALQMHIHTAARPYLDFTVEELQKKSGGKTRPKGNHFSGTSKAVDSAAFHNLQRTMRDIIKQELPNGLLTRYGSFFFVMEGKGIKLYTQAHPQAGGAAWNDLTRQFPQLDMDYMMNQANGQLVVDVGISVNPRRDGEAVVGLWRLDALEASFGAGGFNQGNTHHTNTLGRYGALQADMSAERMRRTHILFRSAYPLQYEATRKKDNQPYFSEDGDAYQLNERWIGACDDREKIYKGKAQERSYGVRDEYRVGGLAVKELLNNASALVCTYVGLFYRLGTLLTLGLVERFLKARVQTDYLDQVLNLVSVSRSSSAGA
jgi:hypothetical protein